MEASYLSVDAAFVEFLQSAVLLTHWAHDGVICLTDLFAAAGNQSGMVNLSQYHVCDINANRQHGLHSVSGFVTLS